MSNLARGTVLKLTSVDIKNFVVISTWCVELLVILGVAFGLIKPEPNSLQATLISAIITSFLTISGAALGAYFLGKAQAQT